MTATSSVVTAMRFLIMVSAAASCLIGLYLAYAVACGGGIVENMDGDVVSDRWRMAPAITALCLCLASMMVCTALYIPLKVRGHPCEEG